MRLIQFVHFIITGRLLVSQMTAAWLEAVPPFSFFLVMLRRVSLLDLHGDGGRLCFPCKTSGRKEDTLMSKGLVLVLFPSPSRYHVVCRMILLGMNIKPWRSRLWTHGLGQGEVPEMLMALWRAQPGGVGSPSHGPGEGEGKQNLRISSALTKTRVEIVENTSRKTSQHFIPVADQASKGAWEVVPLELLKRALFVADLFFFGSFLSQNGEEEEEEEARLLTRGNRTKKRKKKKKANG